MTVPSDICRSNYVTNGVTLNFPTVWKFLANAHVRARYTPTAGVELMLTEGVHYSLVGAGLDGGGTLTTMGGLSPLAAGALVLERTVPLTQLVDLRNQGSFTPAVHMGMMDQLAMADQQLTARVAALESAGAPGSVIAGNGLAFASTTLHVGAGPGIQANADTVQVIFGDTSEVSTLGGSAKAAGAINKAARIDHVHDFVGGTVAGLAVGNASDSGAGVFYARNDHQHGVPAGGPGEDVDGTAAVAGSSGRFADGEHTHQVKLGASATDLADTVGAAGVGPQVSAFDHVHAHGARGGDTLHAVATTTVAGFMAAADKLLQAERQESISVVQTTDATPTLIASFTPVTGQAETVIVTVTGKDKVTGDAMSYRRVACVSREAGVTSIRGAGVQSIWTVEDKAGCDVTIAAATPAINVTVTGIAATNYYWSCHIERRKVVA